MRFVEPSVEYWPQGPGMSGMWSQIARVARLSYDAQPREGETDAQYVERVILKPSRKAGGTYDFDKQHGGVLEFGTVYLKIPTRIYCSNYIFKTYFSVEAIALLSSPNVVVMGCMEGLDNNGHVIEYIYITTNYRYILEKDLLDVVKKYMVDKPEPYHCQRYCFHVITDIGVSREWNRHRASMSINEESTRHVDYTKDKHGNGITYVTPRWEVDDDAINFADADLQKSMFELMCGQVANGKTDHWTAKDYYEFALQAAEFSYKGSREKGWRPEQAREVLNLNTKTSVAYCAYEDAWRHFIRLRGSRCVSGKAHPNIMPLADEIEKKLDELTKL